MGELATYGGRNAPEWCGFHTPPQPLSPVGETPQECPDDCMRCSGESCGIHGAAECDCDVAERHANDIEVPADPPTATLSLEQLRQEFKAADGNIAELESVHARALRAGYSFADVATATPEQGKVFDGLIQRAHEYLLSGGLFNPELANHDAVRDLIMAMRDGLIMAKRQQHPRCTCRWELPQPFNPSCPVHGPEAAESSPSPLSLADVPRYLMDPHNTGKLTPFVTVADIEPLVQRLEEENAAYHAQVTGNGWMPYLDQLLRVIARAEQAEASLQEANEKLMAGTLHVVTCNANHDGPVGGDCCSCPTGKRIKALEASLQQLRAYVQHRQDCESWTYDGEFGQVFRARPCTCGLDPLLKERP